MLNARKAERIGALFASLLFAAGAAGLGLQLYRRWRAKTASPTEATDAFRPLSPALRAKIVQRLQVAYSQGAPLGSGVLISTDQQPALEPVVAEIEALLKIAGVPVKRKEQPPAKGAPTATIDLAYNPSNERYGQDLAGILGLILNTEDAVVHADPALSRLAIRLHLRGKPRFLQDGSVVLR